ncbi:signal peptidase I [Sphingomonas sabuli]|uniref:Signal peptidase I n=1 Tax=Sphingomonas sabuli TaxID=2764186 RepID=A0A7G9L4U3_9SPHN|nr:signal peptidase I [Sphingomonas sabuli]QNM83642.1 signal peptidase I [Sphingomonas sabuli]
MRRPSDQKAKEPESAGGTVRFILIVMAAAWLFRSLLFTPFSIPSGSMLPSLYIGDYLVVSKWPYGYSRYSFPFAFPPFPGRILPKLPERGDVVVFSSPSGSGEDLIKRVIGLPGDTIELRDGHVVLNNRPLGRSAERPVEIPLSANSPCRRITGPGTASITTDGATCAYPSYRETLPNGVSYRVIDQVDNPIADTFGPVTVPAGHLFMMGDNRDDSLDSRYEQATGGVGFLPLDHVVGRAAVTFWSTDGTASYFKPWTWFIAMRSERFGNDYTEAR